MVVAAHGEEAVPTLDDLRRAFEGESLRPIVEVRPQTATLLAMTSIESACAALLRMRWTVLTSPPGRVFWLADAPVLVRAAKGSTVIVGGGIGLPTADVFVPLASGFALHASYKPQPTLRQIDDEEHDALRRWTLFYADRFTFSSVAFDPADPIVVAAKRPKPRSMVDATEAKDQWTRVLRKVLD